MYTYTQMVNKNERDLAAEELLAESLNELEKEMDSLITDLKEYGTTA